MPGSECLVFGADLHTPTLHVLWNGSPRVTDSIRTIILYHSLVIYPARSLLLKILLLFLVSLCRLTPHFCTSSVSMHVTLPCFRTGTSRQHFVSTATLPLTD